MRKSILLTALIAVIAVTLAVALTQTDKGKNWFSTYTKPRQTTSDVASSTVAPAKTDAIVAAATIPTTTPAATPATTDTTTASTTPATTTATADASSGMTPVDLDAAQARLNEQAPAAGDDKKADATPTAATPVAATADAAKPTEAPKSTFKPDVAAALQDRSLGSPNAPIVVYDFSSLSCPHCGHFHNDVLPKIKTEYIDTGKVYWVFHGFPLNEPALKAEMVARCAPKDQYVKLIDLMYKNQERWAFSDDPIPNLSMLLRIAGISDDMFVGCTSNKELQAALLKKIQADGDKYKVNATPTFVFNDGEKTFSGAGTYEGFAFDLDALLAAKKEATSKK